MTDFPATGYLSDASRTEGEMKTALDALLAGVREFPGGGAATTLTISSDSVTPGAGVAGLFLIDTEGAAASDDLANIAQTNTRDGALLLIRCASAARVVTVKHAAGGTGQIILQGAADYQLNDTGRWLLLRRSGTSWAEVGRFHGAVIKALAERTVLDGGTTGGTGNAQTATLTPAPDAYATGMLVMIKAGAANSGAATLNCNSLGAKSIKTQAGADVAAGAIANGGTYLLRYDGTNFVLLNPNVPASAGDISAIGQGLHTIWLGAEAFTPTTTNGAAAYSNELATNDIMVVGKAFDQSTEERAQARFGLPKSYNGGTITAQAVWTATAGTADQTVDWGFSARVYSNDDAIDQAMGTEVTTSDALIATNDEHIAPVSGAITPAGTLSGTPKRCCLQVARKVGTDNLAADAILLGVFVYITLNAATDA